jgi:hypothetical protein
MLDVKSILNYIALYLTFCWVHTFYIAFFVYDNEGFTSSGYNRRGINRSGQIKSKKYNDSDDEYTDTPDYDDNGKEIINKYVNLKYSRMEHVPDMLPFMTFVLVIAYLI